jgi:hypothetical protein
MAWETESRLGPVAVPTGESVCADSGQSVDEFLRRPTVRRASMSISTQTDILVKAFRLTEHRDRRRATVGDRSQEGRYGNTDQRQINQTIAAASAASNTIAPARITMSGRPAMSPPRRHSPTDGVVAKPAVPFRCCVAVTGCAYANLPRPPASQPNRPDQDYTRRCLYAARLMFKLEYTTDMGSVNSERSRVSALTAALHRRVGEGRHLGPGDRVHGEDHPERIADRHPDRRERRECS